MRAVCWELPTTRVLHLKHMNEAITNSWAYCPRGHKVMYLLSTFTLRQSCLILSLEVPKRLYFLFFFFFFAPWAQCRWGNWTATLFLNWRMFWAIFCTGSLEFQSSPRPSTQAPGHRAQPKLWVCFRWYGISWAHLNVVYKSHVWGNHSIAEQGIHKSWTQWAASGIISAEFVRVVTPSKKKLFLLGQPPGRMIIVYLGRCHQTKNSLDPPQISTGERVFY